ncbi:MULTISPECIES: S24 family peptidase [unclassified Arsenophonus]|uniref:S24 family peptidase n=1 Tax=unclassified Arsenophonus TaxID=2627083 RepID=UPI002856244E|nr:S24 family peptidase [Arsenophonus sp.]MDR5611412.1 S24 family peptidase [Arsenophonus sp.]MDR5615453.1 S24 family peptidase [Arsenophonus sp.]
MKLKQRIEFLLKNESIKQKDLARILNTSPQTVNNWLKRNSISREAAQNISTLFGYSLDWLLNGVGLPKKRNNHKINQSSNIPPEDHWLPIATWDDNTPLDDDEVEVQYLKDIEFACGNGRISSYDYNNCKLRFSKSTLRKIGAKSDGSTVLCFPVKGNSMQPLIPDGSVVAIDISNKKIIDGKIYAIEQNGLKRIKILHRLPKGKLIIRSINREEYEDEECQEDEVDIIGRLFWYSVMAY